MLYTIKELTTQKPLLQNSYFLGQICSKNLLAFFFPSKTFFQTIATKHVFATVKSCIYYNITARKQ